MPEAARPAWIIAGAGLLLLCLGFTPEIGAAVRVWNQSTAYGHCWLVLPIVGWLLWERRAVVAGGLPNPTAWPALAAAPVALVWVAADWLGIMEGRQLALIAFAELLLMAALGWRLWWALSPAFLYLLFLVPFGAFLTPALQHFTTDFILRGLRVLDIPFESDAFQIRIPEGTFYVAEACAGLRFLIASVAFGVLYAVTIFRSPGRRALFIAVSCVVPVVANGFRGLGIVVLGHVLGSAEAGAADHLIYGWVFFSLVIVMLALAGLPFREDWEPPALPPPAAFAPRISRTMLAACLPVLLFAFAGPVALRWQDRHAAPATAPSPLLLTLPVNCQASVALPAGPVTTQLIQCGAARLRVVATTLPPGANPARVLAAGRDPASAPLAGEIDTLPWRTPGGAPWTMLTAHDTNHLAAYAIWVDGVQVPGGLRDRARMALDALTGRKLAPRAVAVSIDVSEGDSGAMLRAILEGIRAGSPAT